MNTIFESQAGKVLVILYTLFTLGVYVMAYMCGTETCGLYIVLPIMPWALIFAQDFGLSFPWAVYPIFVLLNASVAYVLGAAIEWLYGYYRDYKEDKQKAVVEQKQSA